MGLLNRIEELEKELAELKSKVKEGPKFPEYGDTYWCIDTEGIVYVNNFEGVQADRNILEIGNVYKTKEQAEFAVEKLKVEAELREFSRPFKDNDNNYFIELYQFDKTLSIDSSEYLQTQGTIYFETAKIANEAIDTIGAERIKKYILGVEG